MKTLIAMLLTVLVLSGCGGGIEKKIIGTWKVDSAKTVMTGEKMKTASAEEKKMMMSMLETITIDVKEDKTFTLNFMMPTPGKWTLEGNTLKMTFENKPGSSVKFGGKDNMDFVVNGDATSMSSTITDKEMSGTLVMVKNPS